MSEEVTRERLKKSMTIDDALNVLSDTNAYGTMDIAKSVILDYFAALSEEPMDDLISRDAVLDACSQSINILDAMSRIEDLPSVTPKQVPCDVYDEYGNYKYPSDVELTEPNTATSMPCEDAISRQAAIDAIDKYDFDFPQYMERFVTELRDAMKADLKADIKDLPSVKPQEPKTGRYEKHIDHTDCIWYGSDSGCPVTCSQYRDGWNDAMDYIFKNGKGYQPYRHDG